MADRFDSLSETLVQFIEQQPIFLATAAPEGRVNLSPKGQQSLKVLTPNQILWENFTGSGNETAAQVIRPRGTANGISTGPDGVRQMGRQEGPRRDRGLLAREKPTEHRRSTHWHIQPAGVRDTSATKDDPVTPWQFLLESSAVRSEPKLRHCARPET